MNVAARTLEGERSTLSEAVYRKRLSDLNSRLGQVGSKPFVNTRRDSTVTVLSASDLPSGDARQLPMDTSVGSLDGYSKALLSKKRPSRKQQALASRSDTVVGQGTGAPDTQAEAASSFAGPVFDQASYSPRPDDSSVSRGFDLGTLQSIFDVLFSVFRKLRVLSRNGKSFFVNLFAYGGIIVEGLDSLGKFF